VIATEWRNNTAGQIIRNRLTVGGFESIVVTPDVSQRNTVLVAGSGATRSACVTPPNSATGDLASLTSENGVSILGCYFPQGLAKAPFFYRCIEMAKQNAQLPFVMVGDLNTGRNDLDIEGKGAPFHCADLFSELSKTAGLVDLWRARHGDRQDWTWYSSKYGFRIDHAFGNHAFIEQFPRFECEIDHEPRLSKLTDHSAIILDLG
jgi:exonuclease III